LECGTQFRFAPELEAIVGKAALARAHSKAASRPRRRELEKELDELKQAVQTLLEND
jgi:hypothetical protein